LNASTTSNPNWRKNVINDLARTALTNVAVWLESGGQQDSAHGIEYFDMSNSIAKRDCGAACCIAGAICLQNDLKCIEVSRNFDGISFRRSAGEFVPAATGAASRFLGLNSFQHSALFYAEGTPYADRLVEIDAAHAARCIRKFLNTGEIDWVGTAQPN